MHMTVHNCVTQHQHATDLIIFHLTLQTEERKMGGSNKQKGRRQKENRGTIMGRKRVTDEKEGMIYLVTLLTSTIISKAQQKTNNQLSQVQEVSR